MHASFVRPRSRNYKRTSLESLRVVANLKQNDIRLMSKVFFSYAFFARRERGSCGDRVGLIPTKTALFNGRPIVAPSVLTLSIASKQKIGLRRLGSCLQDRFARVWSKAHFFSPGNFVSRHVSDMIIAQTVIHTNLSLLVLLFFFYNADYVYIIAGWLSSFRTSGIVSELPCMTARQLCSDMAGSTRIQYES